MHEMHDICLAIHQSIFDLSRGLELQLCIDEKIELTKFTT